MSSDSQINLKEALSTLYKSKHDQFKLLYIHTLFVSQTENVRSWHDFVSWFLGILGVLWGVILYKLDYLINQKLISRDIILLFAVTSLFAFLWKYALVMISSLLSCMDKVIELVAKKTENYVCDLENIKKNYPSIECDNSAFVGGSELNNLFASLYPNPMRWYLKRIFKKPDIFLGYRKVAIYHQASSVYMLLTILFFVLAMCLFLIQLCWKL